MAVIDIAIAGANGRMGKAIAAAAAADPGVRVAARFGRTAGEGLVDAATAMKAAQVIIDFTTPEASVALAEQAAAAGVALICGSTGFDDAQIARIGEAGRKTAIVRAGNFSLGVNMLMGLVAQAARALPADAYDIEVFEAHHRRKVDAPSGTALMLGEAAAHGRGRNLADVEARARDGITGPRGTGDIGFSVMRGGGIIGEHSVVFAAEDEVLTLSHSSRDRGLFARGALAAAKWVVGKPPGNYDMQDVLGFRKAGY